MELYKLAAGVFEEVLAKRHPLVASLNNIAIICQQQGRTQKALTMYH